MLDQCASRDYCKPLQRHRKVARTDIYIISIEYSKKRTMENLRNRSPITMPLIYIAMEFETRCNFAKQPANGEYRMSGCGRHGVRSLGPLVVN